MIEPKFHNIILLGPPGVGKGAQAEILSCQFSLVHLSTGEVIREEIKNGSKLGLRVKEAVEKGKLADDETVLGIIMSQLALPGYRRGFIMDGFPRTIPQAEAFDSLLAAQGKSIDCVIFFDAPDEVLLERLSGREVCSQCGTTYHKKFKPPRVEDTCDLCKGKVVPRKDDRVETLRKRLVEYHQKTEPLIPYYEKTGVLRKVDGSEPIEDVARAVHVVVSGRVLRGGGGSVAAGPG